MPRNEVSAAELARLLGCSRPAVSEMATSGRLRDIVHRQGRHTYFYLADLRRKGLSFHPHQLDAARSSTHDF